jgi:hypothetical protein
MRCVAKKATEKKAEYSRLESIGVTQKLLVNILPPFGVSISHASLTDDYAMIKSLAVSLAKYIISLTEICLI